MNIEDRIRRAAADVNAGLGHVAAPEWPRSQGRRVLAATAAAAAVVIVAVVAAVLVRGPGTEAPLTPAEAPTTTVLDTAAPDTTAVAEPGESGYAPGDPRLFVPQILIEDDTAILAVEFLDGSTAELRWPADLDLGSGGIRPYAVAGAPSERGDSAIVRDLDVTKGDVEDRIADFGEPELLAEYPDGGGGLVGYWQPDNGEGIRYLGFQFDSWAVIVSGGGQGAMLDAELEMWASHLHGDETEQGFLRLATDPPLGFTDEWMELILESSDGSIRLVRSDCAPPGVEEFDDHLLWCDASGLVIVRVTGSSIFRQRVHDELEIDRIEVGESPFPP